MTLLLAIGVLFGATNTQLGRDQVRQVLEGQLSGALNGATIGIDRLDGNLLASPRVEGLLLRSAAGDTLLAVARARIGYRLWPLLRSEVHLTRVHIEGLRARARQDTSGTWDWASLTTPSDAPSTWSVRLDSLSVEDTRLLAVLGRADSTLEVPSLEAGLSGLDMPLEGPMRLGHLSLAARFLPPGEPDAAQLLLGLALDGNRIHLDTLSLRSARSHLTGSGRLDVAALPRLQFGLPDSLLVPTVTESHVLSLSAQPFTFADGAAFVPLLQPQGQITGTFRLEQLPGATLLAADLAARHGGRVTAAARWEERSDGTLMQLDLEMRDVDPDRVLVLDSGTSPVSGTASIRLAGMQIDSLDGRARLAIEPFDVADVAVGRTRLESDWQGGRAHLLLTSALQGAEVRADASGRFLDQQPSGEWRLDVAGLDAARWTGDPALASQLTLQSEGRLSGIEPATMQAEGTLTLLPSPFAQIDSLTASVNAAIQDAQLRWTLGATADGGSVEASGRLDVVRGWMEELRLTTRQLDAASLLAIDSTGTTRSSISALLEGRMALDTWPEGAGALTLQLDSTRWNDIHLALLAGNLSWTPGVATVRVAALPTDSSRVELDLRARSDGAVTLVHSRTLSWTNLDISDLSSTDILQAHLNGSGSVSAVLGPEGVRRLDLDLRGAPSRWGVQDVEDLRLTVEADSRRIEGRLAGRFVGQEAAQEAAPASTSGSTPESTRLPARGAWQLDLRAEDWQADRILAEADMTWDGVDPLAFMGEAEPGTRISAQVRAALEWVGNMPRTADIRVEAGPSRVRDAFLSRALFSGVLADSVLDVEGSMTLADGRFGFVGQAFPFAATPSFTASGDVEKMDIMPLVGRSDLTSELNLTWNVRGSSFDPTEADWQINIDGSPSHLDELLLENLSTHLAWDGAVLDIRDLSSRFNKGSLHVNGPVNLAPSKNATYSDLRATWYIGDLSVVRGLLQLDRLTSGEGTVDLQIYGSPGEIEAEFLVSLTELEINDQHLSSIEASGWAMLDEEWLPVASTARMDLGYISLPTLGIRTTTLQVDQRADVFEFEGGVFIDSGNQVDVAGLINPFARRPWASLRKLDTVLGGQAFTLDRPAGVAFERGWQVDRLTLRSEDQMVGISGGYQDSTGFNLRLGADRFLLDPIGELTGFPELEGRLSGNMALTGNMEYPLIDSDWDVLLTDDGVEDAHITADIKSTPEGLRIDAIVEVPESAPISVAGFLPVFPSLSDKLEERADRTADLNLDIVTDGGSIAWVESFFDPTVLTDIAGRATANIQVAGTIEDPSLSGYLDVDDAAFRLPEMGVTYRMSRFRSTLEGVTVQVQEARIRSGEGIMDVTGSIDFASLTNSSFDLDAQLKEFRAVRNEELHANLSGNVHLGGRTTRPELTGRLTTFNTSFWLTDTAGGDLQQVDISFDDQVMLAENFGYRPVLADTLVDAMWKGLSMDLALVMERDTWIRQRVNPEMAIELMGRMDVQKTRGQEDVNLYRSIEVIPDRSTIKQFGRDFRIAEGVASFNGPIEDMMLQFRAEYEVPSRLNPGQPEVVITLTLSGRLDDLEFNLSSDPTMENTDIVSYIATGRPASESLSFSGNNLNKQVIVGVAAAQLAGLVEGVASSSLGLDVVDIQQDGLKGTRLTAGKYITPRLFIGVTQPFTFGSGSDVILNQERELTIEYKIFEMLLLQLLADASDSPVRVNLAGRYAY
ncbi:MAG: translocation/assembly module TamB domain-containing protein [Bacteroidetes bacterium]|nr:translocation/assembly module TamB domain-containing protein [Bacteroidota bacterium]MDA0873599.1 translocation/assembly module TamB domain-containing protein [Bacteroidota bacterium]